MTLEEQIALFTQKLATKNNLPDGFSRAIKDVISKTISIEEWNSFTQYIANNTSDIKSVEEFVLVLADYIEGYATKDYVDNQDASTLQSAKDYTYSQSSIDSKDADILSNAKSYADNKFETKADAFSGNYNDLTNKPTIPVVPTNISAFFNDSGYLTSVTWNNISGKPTFATVATSGDYNDLSNKPTIPTKLSDLINDGFVTDNSTQYITASKIFKTAVGASTGATIYPSTGTLYTEKDLTSTSYAPQKISLSKAQSGTPFNFQIQSTQGEGHNGVYTFDNSVTGTVTTKEYVDNTFETKTEVDNKDTATLNAAKAYTDAQVMAGASVYEYVLTFADTDTNNTWALKFISTNGTLINTSVPENYQELVDFIKSYGMQRLLPGSVTTYNLDGIAQELNGNPKCAYCWVTHDNSTDTLYARADGTLTPLTIDANNLDANTINLVKRQC